MYKDKCSKCGLIRSLYSLSDTNFRTRYKYYESDNNYKCIKYITCVEVTIKDILE
jgi:hypothetical protein